jgi:antitoxin FitA
MTTISVTLSDEGLTRLKEMAERSGVSPEQFLQDRVEELLARTGKDFAQAARYVLTKNKDLYKRLTQIAT